MVARSETMLRLSTYVERGATLVGLWLALDAALQCIGAWTHVFVCAPARGYSLPRVLGLSTDLDLFLTCACALAMMTAASVGWVTRRCCDVTMSTESA